MTCIEATIDRFEEDLAVLLLGEHGECRIDFPRSLLPEGVREGTSLIINIDIDECRTTRLEKEVSSLKEKLLKKNKNIRS